MLKKSSFFFLVFLLPILFFFFFKRFGENEFKVPFYHIEKTQDIPVTCALEYHFPYQIPIVSQLNLEGITVVSFMSALDSAQYKEALFQRSQVLSRFAKKKVEWIFLQIGDGSPSSISQTISLPSASYHIEKKCYYLSASHNMVLVDSDRKIRGYYDITLLQEIDRLVMELSILLKI